MSDTFPAKMVSTERNPPQREWPSMEGCALSQPLNRRKENISEQKHAKSAKGEVTAEVGGARMYDILKTVLHEWRLRHSCLCDLRELLFKLFSSPAAPAMQAKMVSTERNPPQREWPSMEGCALSQPLNRRKENISEQKHAKNAKGGVTAEVGGAKMPGILNHAFHEWRLRHSCLYDLRELLFKLFSYSPTAPAMQAKMVSTERNPPQREWPSMEGCALSQPLNRRKENISEQKHAKNAKGEVTAEVGGARMYDILKTVLHEWRLRHSCLCDLRELLFNLFSSPAAPAMQAKMVSTERNPPQREWPSMEGCALSQPLIPREENIFEQKHAKYAKREVTAEVGGAKMPGILNHAFHEWRLRHSCLCDLRELLFNLFSSPAAPAMQAKMVSTERNPPQREWPSMEGCALSQPLIPREENISEQKHAKNAKGGVTAEVGGARMYDILKTVLHEWRLRHSCLCDLRELLFKLFSSPAAPVWRNL